MTSPGGTGFLIGRGYLDLVADSRGLRRDISEAIRRASAGQRIDIPIRTDTDRFLRDINGRLHDERGRFMREGGILGSRFGDGFAGGASRGLGGLLSGILDPKKLGIGALIAAIVPLSTVLVGLVSSMGLALTSGVALIPMLMGLGGAVGIVMAAFKGAATATDWASKKFTSTLGLVKDDLKKLQTVAAGKFLPGVTDFLEKFRTLMPSLNMYIRDMGTQLSWVAVELGDLVSSQFFRGQLDIVMAQSTVAMEAFSKSIGSIGVIFMDLAASSSHLISRVSIAFQGWTSHIAAMLEAKRVSGELDAFFQRAGDSMAKWFNILSDLFMGIVNVLRAANPAGEQMASSLETIMHRFREWTGSEEGQARIKAFFDFIMNIDYGRILQIASAVTVMGLAIKALTIVQGVGGGLAWLAGLGPMGIAMLGLAAAFVIAAGAIKYLYDSSEPLRSTLSSVGESFTSNILPPLREFWAFIQDNVIPVLRDGFIAYLGQVGDILTGSVFPALREALDTVLPALTKAWNTISNAVKDNKDQLGELWNAAKTVVMFFMSNVIPVVADVAEFFIGLSAGAISALINTIGFLIDAVKWIGRAFEWVRDTSITVWNEVVSAVVAAAGWISGVFTSIVDTVTGAFNWIYGIVSTVMSAIGSVITFALDIVKQLFVIAFNFINDNTGGSLTKMHDTVVSVLGTVSAFISSAMDTVVNMWQTAWGVLTGAVSAAWNWISSRTSEASGEVSGEISSFVGTVTGIFGSLRDTIKSVWHSIWSWVSDTMSTWSNKISNVVGSIKDRVMATFRAIPGAIVTSINVLLGMIDTVINLVNKILPGSIHITGLGRVSVPQGYATGGPIRGAGTGTSDSIPIMASDGEFMLRARSARGLADDFGPGFLNWLNHYDLRSGDRDTALIGPKRYADGGLISRVQANIRGADPLPYVWGAVGPSAYDCSGIVGEVWAQLTGNQRFRRHFTTYDLPGAGGFVPGHGTYTIGLSREHVVGNLGGLAFEAANPNDGIIVGAGATSVDRMPAQYHLPQMGTAFIPAGSGVEGFSFAAMVDRLLNEIVSPIRRSLPQPGGMFSNIITGVFDAAVGGLRKKSFDSGGLLMPGPTLVNNGTGRPETVRTAEQEAALGSGQPLTINITMDMSKVRDVQDLVEFVESMRSTARSYS